MAGSGSVRLPSLTNLNVRDYPLEAVLPRLAKAGKDKQAQKRAVTGRKRESRGWTQTGNYLGALGALGVLHARDGLTELGHEFADLSKSPSAMKRRLAEHVLRSTSLSIVIQVLRYVAPRHSGKELKDECISTLEGAFDVSVPTRRQWMDYTFGFLRYLELTDDRHRVRLQEVRRALGQGYSKSLTSVTTLSSGALELLHELVQGYDEGYITAFDLKERIRERTGQVVETGLGGQGLGKRLRDRGLCTVRAVPGRGQRKTKMRLRSAKLRELLHSPLGQAYFRRSSDEPNSLLERLDDIAGTPLADILARLRGRRADTWLEVLAAKLAFKMGCRDIVLRARTSGGSGLAAGEKDVLATVPRPFPHRLLVQCKAQKSPLGTAGLYREIAIAVLSNDIRTIVFLSKSGYTPSALDMQRSAARRFPWLALAFLSGDDLESCSDGKGVAALVRERLARSAEDAALAETTPNATQVVRLAQALRDEAIEEERIQKVIDRVWPGVISPR